LTRFAKIITLLFHPLLMPILALYLIFNTNTYLTHSVPGPTKNVIYIIVLIFTFLLPAINAFFLKKNGVIENLQMDTLRERKIPFLLAVIYYFLGYYCLRQMPLPPVIYLVVLGALLSVIVAFVVSLKWKISIHMIGIGGVSGAILAVSHRFMEDMNVIIMLLVICAGLVGFARLHLGAHKPAQVYSGFFVGVACELIMILGIQ